MTPILVVHATIARHRGATIISLWRPLRYYFDRGATPLG
jgi:hypothetical protein